MEDERLMAPSWSGLLDGAIHEELAISRLMLQCVRIGRERLQAGNRRLTAADQAMLAGSLVKQLQYGLKAYWLVLERLSAVTASGIPGGERDAMLLKSAQANGKALHEYMLLLDEYLTAALLPVRRKARSDLADIPGLLRTLLEWLETSERKQRRLFAFVSESAADSYAEASRFQSVQLLQAIARKFRLWTRQEPGLPRDVLLLMQYIQRHADEQDRTPHESDRELSKPLILTNINRRKKK